MLASFRSPVLWVALLAAGSAVAAPKDNSAVADCLQKATIQLNIDNAQCSGYPPSEARNYCLIQAVQTYSAAVGVCSKDTASASVRRSTRGLGAVTIKP